MELTTLLFLGFFAAVALLNYTLPRVLRPYCLLAASYLFYCWGANDRLLVPVLVAATLATWGCGLVIGKCRIGPVRVIFLLLAVFTCVGLLFYYKYWNLLAADILSGTVLQPRTDMVTPLGLGYFTLAALSYTVDVYKRRCKVELNPLHYALFVSFFPTMTTQLSATPIFGHRSTNPAGSATPAAQAVRSVCCGATPKKWSWRTT